MNFPEFKMIDVICSQETDEIVTRSFVDPTSSLFKHHFPGRPLLPGTIQTELMAQAASFNQMIDGDFEALSILAAIKSASFRKEVIPDCTLLCRAKRFYQSPSQARYDAELWLGDSLVSNARLVIASIEFADEDTRTRTKNDIQSKFAAIKQ